MAVLARVSIWKSEETASKSTNLHSSGYTQFAGIHSARSGTMLCFSSWYYSMWSAIPFIAGNGMIDEDDQGCNIWPSVYSKRTPPQ